MKSKKSKLKYRVWSFLMAFSSILLLFLFLTQVVFLKAFYKSYKTKQLNEIAEEIIKLDEITEKELENISFEKGICISAYKSDNLKIISNYYNRGCVIGDPKIKEQYIQNFIKSGKSTKDYFLDNMRFNNSNLVKAIFIGDTYVFLNTSLEPLESTLILLKSQFGFIAAIIFLLSILVGYFISNQLSEPIENISDSAKNIVNGNYSIPFNTNSNIYEIHELSTILEKSRIELSKTDELRKDLMANVGHDLKTPLTMIKAYAEMTRDMDQSKEKRTNNLDIIIEETDRLNLLVKDILDLSKTQSDTEVLSREKFDLNIIIKDIIRRYDILITSEKYNIIFEECEETFVYADKKRVEQVIYNLINNAINYTGEDKKITISLSKKNKKARVEITDTGKGIEKKDIDYIWDKYYHNEKKHKRNTIGTGLGLSIVKAILEKHKCEYGVKSIKGKGTTFYFSLNTIE